MSYDLHVARTKNWTESNRSPIMYNEWIRLVESEDSMQFTSQNYQDNTNFAFQISCDDMTTCMLKVGDKKNERFYLKYHEGRITVKNPNRLVISKLKELATILDAYVIGDEGEEY